MSYVYIGAWLLLDHPGLWRSDLSRINTVEYSAFHEIWNAETVYDHSLWGMEAIRE